MKAGAGHGPTMADDISLANLIPQMAGELSLARSTLLGECEKGSKWHDLPQMSWIAGY